MKIKRFFAPDMRQAIRRVRETLGPDAVILSNKTVEGGVELVAAIDYHESAFATPPSAAPEAAPPAAPRREAPQASRPARVEWSQDPAIVAMRREMQAMRRMMETELGGLAWRELGQRRPHARELLRRLADLGLPVAMARVLAEKAGEPEDLEQGWRKALYLLAGGLPVADTDLLDTGGIVAVIGPTGVGKTTTIAKLAARFVMRHGARHLADVERQLRGAAEACGASELDADDLAHLAARYTTGAERRVHEELIGGVAGAPGEAAGEFGDNVELF